MARYSVSGDVTPDCTTADTGEQAGSQGGLPNWRWLAGGQEWWLQATGTGWLLCVDYNGDGFLNFQDSISGPNWQSAGTDGKPPGEYTPSNGASGTVIVAEYVEPPPTEYAVLTINDGPLAGEYIVLKTR
jgi:hypothetical protein